MELDKELWPCAMKHACFQHNARQLGTKVEGVKFGSVVWVKSKKERGPFDPKWERGKYMGPADDVRGGHVVRLDDGLWLRTLHMRTVRDDEVEFEDEEHVVDLIEPTKRVRGKTKLSDPEMRAIRKQERNALVKELLESKIWDSPQAKVERPQMKDGETWDGAAYINLGAYQHGGITSITRATEKFNKEEMGFVLPVREPVLKMMNAGERRDNGSPNDGSNWDDYGIGGKLSGTWVVKRVYSSKTGVGQREFLPEMGGERLDSMVVPGGRVELRLKWAIKYIPDLAGQGEEVVMTSAPLLPLGHDEEERMRSRVTWLSEFVEEERKIKARQAERGEYATQRERQLFYKLDDAIDYMNEILCLSHQAREQATMSMMKLAQETETTPEVEE
ncbi:unnamed protein product, partial [Symbiodinium sp. KB8]